MFPLQPIALSAVSLFASEAWKFVLLLCCGPVLQAVLAFVQMS